MALLAIPNISVGAPGESLAAALEAIAGANARLLDVHSDSVHNRSVLTTTGDESELVAASVALAQACKRIDLTSHVGIHPRVGALDVCPFVPHDDSIDTAVTVAHRAGREIAEAVDTPVFFYGAASTRPETKELPDIRRGGLQALSRRIEEGLHPDEGPSQIDPHYGVVLVGARGPLIAFNVWLRAPIDAARAIAGRVRERGRIRALGLGIDDTTCQVSMNLIAPDEVGIDDAFRRVEDAVSTVDARVIGTEIVGLVPERFLPSPNAKAVRLLLEPDRSLESALDD